MGIPTCPILNFSICVFLTVGKEKVDRWEEPGKYAYSICTIASVSLGVRSLQGIYKIHDGLNESNPPDLCPKHNTFFCFCFLLPCKSQNSFTFPNCCPQINNSEHWGPITCQVLPFYAIYQTHYSTWLYSHFSSLLKECGSVQTFSWLELVGTWPMKWS